MSDDRLESWKEIAGWLGREVRTVQGWEKNENLPIHRHLHARQGSVYAFKSELDAWREARKTSAETTLRTGPNRVAVMAGLVGMVLITAAFLSWKTRAAKATGANVSSVVVLPFLDLSPQKDQEYFCDGLTEEIIDALSRVPNLRVVARTSAFAFKGKGNDIRQIGHQLNVDAVLEGSVRKAGVQLRITAQLNRVSDGTHLWSRTYNRELRDVFAVQQEISQAISKQLRGGDIPKRRGTADLAAYDLYQEGRYFFNQHDSPDSYNKAIHRYRQAIERDPQFALAYSAMADAYAYMAENQFARPRDVMPKAKEAAEKALALDDNLAEAHTSVGIVKLDYDWDRDGAQRELRRAMDLDPGSGWVRHWYAHSLEAQGRLEEAMKEMRAALDLDPLSVVIYWDVGNELLMARRYEEALRHLAKANELFPNFPIILWMQAEAFYQKGDGQSAHRVIEVLKATHPEMASDPGSMALLANAAARDGRREEARRVLDQLEQLHKTQYVEPFFVLALCSTLGDRARLKLWEERSWQERSTFFLYGPLTTYFYNDDPKVKAFLAQHR